MKTTITKKMSVLLTGIALTGLVGSKLLYDGSSRAQMENELIRQVKQKMEAYAKHIPGERLYIQTDKPFYQPGDDIWLSAMVRDEISLKASSKSDIVHVELISPKGTLEKKISLIAHNGKANGDFLLDREISGGLYKIRAYTEWMRNGEPDACFEKEIQVQNIILPRLKMKLDFEKKAYGAGDEVVAKLELNSNENAALEKFPFKFIASVNGTKLLERAEATENDGVRYIKFKLPPSLSSSDGLLNVMINYEGNTESISRSIPIVLNQIRLNFYPEGGDLVNQTETKVAFRAFNEFGKPADVEGFILNAKGEKVASFASFHQGMGAFALKPQAGERYKAKITRPEGIEQEFFLPEVLQRGYVLNLENKSDNEIGVTITSTEIEDLAVVAQVRGKLYYSTVINPVGGKSNFSFSTENFPIGVAQVTLFDSKGIARAERLVFVNKNKQLNISVNFDKEKYLPREKVKMTLNVKDERGLPAPANLCIAVVNDQLLSFADSKSGHLISELLLQQDLKEKVEDPSFYFNKKEVKSDKALDYLLMTSGWRRFTWEKLLEEELPVITYTGQKALITGRVMNSETNSPMKNARLKTSTGKEYPVNEQGEFRITDLDLSSQQQLTFSADGFYPQVQSLTDYEQNLSIFLYKTRRPIYRHKKVMAVGGAEPMLENDNGLADLRQNEAMEFEAAPMAEFNGDEKAVVLKNIPLVPKNNQPALAADSKPRDKEENMARAAVEDLRMASLARKMDDRIVAIPQVKYYRARQFYAPVYEKQGNVETRTDFRNTVYWNPEVVIGYSGKKTIEFYTSDNITSFRATIEGLNNAGELGRCEETFFTQLPFSLSTKVPLEVATEDQVSIPLTLKNNTNGPLGGELVIKAPAGFIGLNATPTVQTIMPGSSKTIYLDYKVTDRVGEGELSISFRSCGLNDAFIQKIQIVPKGFPVKTSFSSQEMEREYSFTITNQVKGSLKASLTAFPNVVSDLMKGVEGILQEPYGCFEQTSCTAYPNAMVLDYLKNTDSKDDRSMARATELLDRGYKRLTTFETSSHGYEWFGANPAHEGLTAYGIMEFVDMQKAGQSIDQKMLDRTALWLLNHRDGKGGFQREQRALHDFGRISDDVMNGYIVYALAEAGYKDLKKEFEATYSKAISTGDSYLLAMTANAAYSMNDPLKGKQALQRLLAKQQENGSINGASHSITYSQGTSLNVETTALGILAILKSNDKDLKALSNAVQYLVGARSGSGAFSSTQGTILALKALTAYAKFSKRTSESGQIVVYVDGRRVANKHFEAGEQGAIILDGIDAYLKGEGTHSIKIKYEGIKTALPYALSVNWNTSLPNSDKECQIGLDTKLSSKSITVGETVRLTASIVNRKDVDVPSTIAIIGIPAGLTVQAWQLKELQEKNAFDYYEIKGNNVAFYYRGLAAGAKKEIKLDLKAEIAGEFDAPASAAYLYYTNEFRTWKALDRVTVKKPVSGS